VGANGSSFEEDEREPVLRALLGEVVWVLSHMKENSLSAKSHRLARRRGKKKAIMALAQSILVIISHLLSTKQPYSDLGADYVREAGEHGSLLHASVEAEVFAQHE
jgi:hypothetical protein